MKDLTATESKLRECAEKEASQLQNATEKLQWQIQNNAITVGYFNLQLNIILHIAEKLRKKTPLNSLEMLW